MNENTRIALEQFVTAVQEFIQEHGQDYSLPAGVVAVPSPARRKVLEQGDTLKAALQSDETIP